MLRTRKRWISLLVTLAMLVAFCLPVASAATLDYVKISGGYTYVKAEDGVDGGSVTIAADTDYSVNDAVYVEVVLPEGVKINSDDAPTLTGLTQVGSTDNSITAEIYSLPATITFDKIDIDSDVTGNIVAEVRVWSVEGNTVKWEVLNDVTIAKIKSGDVSVSAASAKTLTVGSAKEGAKITLKELSPGAFSATAGDNDIFLTIKNSNVKWDKVRMSDNDPITDYPVTTSGVGLNTIQNNDTFFSNSDKTLHLTVNKATTTMNGRIEIRPFFVVQPGAEGDVVIKISGDNVPTTELTVAKIGQGTVDVKVDKADKDSVYIGQTATFENVVVTLNPSVQLNDGDYITITLPEGLKWVDDNPLTCSSSKISSNGRYNGDRSIWLSIVSDESADVDLEDFEIAADYNATPGDLEVTFGGAVEGTYKIGSVKNAFTVTAEPVNLPQRGSDVAGGKIVITEDADGALFATDQNNNVPNVPDYLDIVLPMGMTWARTPDIDVVDGDIDVSIEGIDGDTLKIEVKSPSNLASTIELTDVYFNIDNRAALGDAVAKVGKEYNKNSSNYLASVKVGTIVSPTAGTATMKIGDPTIVINGETKVMEAAPYIKNSRTYVSVTYAALACGVAPENIMWDGVNRTVTVIKGDRIAQFKIGSNVMTLNGAVITMDTAPEIVNARTMMPVTWVALALGGNTAWDAENQIVTVTVN